MGYQKSEKASVEGPVVKEAKKLGIPVLKINPLYAAGWPDRVFFPPGGRPLFIEFKRPGGKLSPKQEEIIAILRSNGYDVEVCDDPVQGKAYLRSRLEAHGVHEKGDAVRTGASRVRAVPRSRSS